mgnify:CR=1 FL=1
MWNFNLNISREARSRSPINILYAAPGGPGITRSIIRVFAARSWKPKKMDGISTVHLRGILIHRRRITEQTLKLFLGLVLWYESKE